MKKIYLDNAATTAIDSEVLNAVCRSMQEEYGNPSSAHTYGREVRGTVEVARKTIAGLLNCLPSEIVFTSCGTEANNSVIVGAIRSYRIRHVISSPIEHHAVGHCLEKLQEEGLIGVSMVKLDERGSVDYDYLEVLLQRHPNALVSLMHANNEIGNLTDLYRVANLCRTYGAYFHSDTVQSVGHYRHDLKQLGVDFLTTSAHKFHGPKGIGFMYIRRNKKIAPYLNGGAQERGMRAGTENTAGIVGLAKAMEIAYRDLDAHAQHIRQIKQHMIDRLQDSIPEIVFNGESGNLNRSLYTVLSVSLPKINEHKMMLFNLDLEGIMVSGGSACSSGSSKDSHVIQALYPHSNRESIRFSFRKYTTTEEVDYAVDTLARLYQHACSLRKTVAL